MTTLREAAQQALEALETLVPTKGPSIYNSARDALRAALAQQAEPTGKDSLQVESVVAENATTQQQIEQTPPSDYRRGYWDGFNIGKREGRIEAEDAQQQAEPDHETRAELAEQQVVQLAEERDHYRSLWQKAQQAEPVQEPAFHGFMSDDGTQVDVCFSPSAPRRDGTYATAYYTAPPHRVAQQAEPLNLSDPAVQKRLATQWGYVPAAAQAEPVEPVAWNWMLDGLPYGRACYGDPPDADIAERAATAGRTVRLLYTAPPQRKPLTEEEIDRICALLGFAAISPAEIVRAVERAHGIKE